MYKRKSGLDILRAFSIKCNVAEEVSSIYSVQEIENVPAQDNAQQGVTES